MDPRQTRTKRKIARNLEEMGGGPAVERFLNKYGKDNTKRIYALELTLYLRWLRHRISMTPDELIIDNLRCIYESSATDVTTKRKHTDWLEDYINRYLVEKGHAQNTRVVTAAIVQQFYKRNDSQLFGDFQVSRTGYREPARPLDSREIRMVLKTLSVGNRTPLLCIWHSGVEVNRMLTLQWSKVEGIEKGEYPFRLQIFGRKKHDRPYYTFLGRDAIDHLKVWKGRWTELEGRSPHPEDPIFLGKRSSYLTAEWLNDRLRKEAINLSKQGLITNNESRSWHSHALRHSFRSEAAHAGVKPEVSEFFLGHLGGINYVYNHRDELHPDDMAREYMKIEPFISLDFTESTLRQEYEGKERQLITKVMTLERLYEDLKREVLSRQQTQHPSAQATT